jgi:hypothetical protein
LKARLALASALPKEPWCAIHFFTLGELLEKLQEPCRAREAYENARQCDQNFQEAALSVSRLSGVQSKAETDLARKQDSHIKENISITLPAARSRRNPAKMAIVI